MGASRCKMPVQKSKNRTDGARRTVLNNIPDDPEIPEMSSMRVSDMPWDLQSNPLHPNPEMDKAQCLLLHDLHKVKCKQPFKDELKQRYIVYKDLSEYLD